MREADVGLDQLATDLKTATADPALSYIVPNACHDGGELPCEPGQPAGPVAAEAFLETVVPEIEASPAYKEGGPDRDHLRPGPPDRAEPDTSACCVSPAYPNLPAGAAPKPSQPARSKPSGGGGKVGMLLISPFVAPGSINETAYYNHFSLLLSVEELFELEPLGYAGEPALAAFDSTVFNSRRAAAPAAATAPAGSRRRLQSSPSSSKKPWRARPELKVTR